MNATRVYSILQEACRALEDAQEYAIAAHIGQGMALIQERYRVGQDHLDAIDHD